MPVTHPTRDSVDDDAIGMLTNDHDEIVELFERYGEMVADGASDDERKALAEEICSMLVVNAAVKDEVFYPAARTVLDHEYLIDEALIAQDSSMSLIDEILGGDPMEPRYDAQMQNLHELILQSFETESTELFPRLRDTALDLAELGAEMSAREEFLMSVGEDGGAGLS